MASLATFACMDFNWARRQKKPQTSALITTEERKIQEFLFLKKVTFLNTAKPKVPHKDI